MARTGAQQQQQWKSGKNGQRGGKAGLQKKGSSTASQQAPPENPRVLLVVLSKLVTSCTDSEKCLAMYYLMSQFARVERISLFQSKRDPEKEQLLVQFDTHEGALLTHGYLDGKEVSTLGPNDAPWACHFTICPSKEQHLNFQFPDERNHDYKELNGQLAKLTPYDFVWGQHVKGAGWLAPCQPREMVGRVPQSTSALPHGRVGTCIHVSGLPDPAGKKPVITAQMLYRVCSQYGGVVAVKVLSQIHNAKKAIVQFDTVEEAERMRAHFDGFDLFGKEMVTAKKSKHPNAWHWAGAVSEDWMFSRLNDAPGAVAEEPVAPSRAVLVHAWDSSVELAVCSFLALHAIPPPMCIPLQDGRRVLEFEKREFAFRLIAHLHGAVVRTAPLSRARLSFTRPLTCPALPAAWREKNMPIQTVLRHLELERYSKLLKGQGIKQASHLAALQLSDLQAMGIDLNAAGMMLESLNRLHALGTDQAAGLTEQDTPSALLAGKAPGDEVLPTGETEELRRVHTQPPSSNRTRSGEASLSSQHNLSIESFDDITMQLSDGGSAIDSEEVRTVVAGSCDEEADDDRSVEHMWFYSY